MKKNRSKIWPKSYSKEHPTMQGDEPYEPIYRTHRPESLGRFVEDTVLS